jgi:uncharacterized protein YdaL
MSDRDRESFERAGSGRQANVFGEFYDFFKHNKKFWLFPIIVMLLGMGLLIMLGGTAVAPFIYTLF